MMKAIIQILPAPPTKFDGVGDFALNLARRLRSDHDLDSVLVCPGAGSIREEANEFQVVDLLDFERPSQCDGPILLHYVNYGFDPRGLPRQLPAQLNKLKERLGRACVTFFHELFASGPPWRRVYWTQREQQAIAQQIASLSVHCFVTNEVAARQLRRLSPAAAITIQPIPATFGEPELSRSQIEGRDPRRWAICGGSAILLRSLRSLRRVADRIPADARPTALSLIGGRENPLIRKIANELPFKPTYHPGISAGEASYLLRTCSYLWIDYFDSRKVPLPAILKSSSFANGCAHALVPVFPRDGIAPEIDHDSLPGPFFVSTGGTRLPVRSERAECAGRIHEWYRRHASLKVVAEVIHERLFALNDSQKVQT